MVETNFKTELEQVEEEILEYKEEVKIGESLTDLLSSDSFKLIIEKMYFENESQRILSNLIEPSHLKRDVILNLHEGLTGIKSFKTFIQSIIKNADTAVSHLSASETYRSELLSKV